MVNKHFHGDMRAAKARWAAIGRYNYERMAGSFEPGSPLRTQVRHPGTVQEFLCVYWQPDLLQGPHLDVQFMAED